MAKAKAPKSASLVKEYLVQPQDPYSDRAVSSTMPSAEFCAIPCPSELPVVNVDNAYVTRDRQAIERLVNAGKQDPNVKIKVFWRYQVTNNEMHDCTEEFAHPPYKPPAKVARQIAAQSHVAGQSRGAGW